MRPVEERRVALLVDVDGTLASVEWRHYRPVAVIDDRPSVIAMWRAEGLAVVEVAGPGLAPRSDDG